MACTGRPTSGKRMARKTVGKTAEIGSSTTSLEANQASMEYTSEARSLVRTSRSAGNAPRMENAGPQANCAATKKTTETMSPACFSRCAPPRATPNQRQPHVLAKATAKDHSKGLRYVPRAFRNPRRTSTGSCRQKPRRCATGEGPEASEGKAVVSYFAATKSSAARSVAGSCSTSMKWSGGVQCGGTGRPKSEKTFSASNFDACRILWPPGAKRQRSSKSS
mmetsp:Transcript_15382/g.51816  ORF Transcript_15382/g.51816 Transcript_15382/m.51816 type:complete len:222 (+) Transcript_15382:490-1155(+)